MTPKLVTAMVIALVASSIAWAEESNPSDCNCNEKHTNRHASFYYENDALGVLAGRKESDKWYTNGLKLVYSYDESCALPHTKVAHSLANWLGTRFGFPDDKNTRHGVVVAQLMFTPSNILKTDPQPEDRYYGGWLYFGHVLQSTAQNTHIKTAELDAGIVGPRSFAEPLQKFIHKEILRTKVPQGWDNQIKSELGVQINYNDIDKLGAFPIAGEWEADVSRYWGVTAGTVFDNMKVGIILRTGNNLHSTPASIIESPLISDEKFNRDAFHLLARFEIQDVLHNTFIDGSFFHSPPFQTNIKREPFVKQATAGFVWEGICGCDNKLSFLLTWRTPEFTSAVYGKRGVSVFGTLNYEWKL